MNSRPLGHGAKDRHGLSQGLYDLASGPEVLGYLEQVMNEQLLPSGRVRYLPMHEVLPQGQVRSLLSCQVTTVQVRRKTIESSHLNTQVPSTRGLKWLEMLAANMASQHRWTRDPGLAKWLVGSRLDGFLALSRGVGEDEHDKRELLQRVRTLGGLARAKFGVLMDS